MADMFLGEFTGKVDGKGRMSIPAEIRDVLRDGDPSYADGTPARLILNYALKPGVLIGFSQMRAKEYAQRVALLPRSDPDRVHLARAFGSGSREFQVDDTGRIVLPKLLRDAAGLKGDVVVTGLIDCFEITTPEINEQSAKAAQEWRNGRGDADPLAVLDKMPPLPPGS